MKKLGVCTILILFLSVFAAQAQSKDKGGCFTLEAGVLTGVDRLNLRGFSVSPVGGYNFNAHWFLGGGATFNYAKIGPQLGCFFLPLFGRVKYSLQKSKFTPYVSCDVGYDFFGFGINYDMNPHSHQAGDILLYGAKMGFYFRPEIGVSMRLNKRRAMHLGVGYTQKRGDLVKYEWVRNKENRWDLEGKRHNLFRMLTFRAGFTF